MYTGFHARKQLHVALHIAQQQLHGKNYNRVHCFVLSPVLFSLQFCGNLSGLFQFWHQQPAPCINKCQLSLMRDIRMMTIYITPRIPNSSPLHVRHKNRHLAISREPRVVEYIRWWQNDRKNMKKFLEKKNLCCVGHGLSARRV